ncbi:MAG: SMC-Scp complex subunit ScpB [Planctomycetes bacterium]|jgi:segregation and condensation protein B|nr:SMC-Scp complex subunit ScpB [Phycisphaerae bacterium]NBB96354.1 SMC-Scp complex subunit ScpB [Planctomycetota bacterium]
MTDDNQPLDTPTDEAPGEHRQPQVDDPNPPDDDAQPEPSDTPSRAETGAQAAARAPKRGLDASDAEVAATVEALLFASDAPLPASRIASVAELPGGRVKKAIAALNERYAEVGGSFRIEEIAGGFQMLTLPEYNDILRQLFASRKDARLSQAAMETLAIVAYRQPILRADVEAIRGVACGEVLRSLLERNLIKIVGRAEVIGRPMLYGTTKAFLEVFGLASLDDLPRVDELRTPEEQQSGPADDVAADNGDEYDEEDADDEIDEDEFDNEDDDMDEDEDDEDWDDEDDEDRQ